MKKKMHRTTRLFRKALYPINFQVVSANKMTLLCQVHCLPPPYRTGLKSTLIQTIFIAIFYGCGVLRLFLQYSFPAVRSSNLWAANAALRQTAF